MGVGEAVGKALFKPFVRRFIAGPTPEDAIGTVRDFNAQGVGGIVSSLGEHVQDPAVAREGVEEYKELLDLLAGEGLDGSISVKPTHMGLEISEELAGGNLLEVTSHAQELGEFVWVDMERSTFTDATLRLYEAMLDAWSGCGICLQANLKRTPDDLKRLLGRDGAPPVVRLVKGAYDEPAGIAHRDKADVDRAFLDLLETLFREEARFAVASHDPTMVQRALKLDAEVAGEGWNGRWEVQMLLGVRDDAKADLARRDVRVHAYIPYGTEWFPYYWRRIQERRENLYFALKAAVKR